MARKRSGNTGPSMIEPTGDDEVSQVLKGIVERARPILEARQTARVRDNLTGSEPLVPPDTPLSPRSVAHLATYGVGGPRTYGEAKAHLEQTASSFGLPVGGTKKVTESGTSTNVAGHVRAKLDPGQGRTLPPHEAELLDMVDTLHRGIRGFMTHPTSSTDPLPNRVEKLQAAAAIEDANPAPQEAPKSSRPRTPRDTPAQKVKKATKKINASDRPLVDLPPAGNKRELTRRQKMIDAEAKAIASMKKTANLEALKRVNASHEAFTVEHGPGGWASVAGESTVSSTHSTAPAVPSAKGPRSRISTDVSSPLKLRDVVDSTKEFIAKEDALDAKKLAARSKYPEQDNPVY